MSTVITNYRAQFTLVPKPETEDAYFELINLITKWLVLQMPADYPKDKILGGLMHGNWNYSQPGYQVRTMADGPEFYGNSFQYLAFQVKHPQREGPMTGWRSWINDFGIETTSEGHILFSLINSYEDRPGYMDQVVEPKMSTPRIITTILGSDHWHAYSGGFRLYAEPIQVNNENVKDFMDRIFDPNRKIPIIYVSQTRGKEFLIDPHALATKTLGNALVYMEEESSVAQYMHAEPSFKPYRCTLGSVRIYFPGANKSKPKDPARHRFFTETRIQDYGAPHIAGIIAESLVRRSVLTLTNRIQRIQDIERIRNERELVEARANQEDKFVIEYLSQDNLRLKDEIDEVRRELNDYIESFDYKEDQLNDVRGELEKARQSIYDLQQENKGLKKKSNTGDARAILPKELPATVAGFLDWIAEAYPETVVVLDAARKSAVASSLEPREFPSAYRLIKSIPETLFRVMFNERGNPTKLYQEQSGFELALTEGQRTKDDAELARLRKVVFEGEEIDISAHVKMGNKPGKLLRIHFHAWRRDHGNKIIIGHCGDHMETYSSRNF